MARKVKCRHNNIWLVCGGSMVWCYECGAIRPNIAGNRKCKIYWQKPSYSKVNPAMNDNYAAKAWSETIELLKNNGGEE